MNEPQEKMSGEPQPTKDFKATSFQKTLAISFGCTLAVGFGPWIYKSIGETTGWGTYTIATFCVGTFFMCVLGGLIGGVSQMVADSFGKEVKS